MKFTEQERLELRLKLITVMSDFIVSQTETDNNIGYVPDNIEQLMADAAFGVLDTVNAVNHYFDTEAMLK
jgi:hypothetical protein